MKIVKLYRFERANGGVTVSPNKPEGEYTELVRLVADDGKKLTRDGVKLCGVIDTETADGWREVAVDEDGNIIPEVEEPAE